MMCSEAWWLVLAAYHDAKGAITEVGITLRDFKEIIRFNIAHGLKQSILGLGAPGLGKSELIKEIADEFGYRLIDQRLAQMSEVEIGGLIYPDKAAQKTQWLKPDFFPEEGEQKAILLLDEITSAPKRVQIAAYQLVLDRRIGKHRLPESTVIIALGNREEDDGVFVRLAAPLANRFDIYEIDLDVDVWLNDFAMSSVSVKLIDGKMRPFNVMVSSFISNSPERLHTQKENADGMIFASPRSWAKVSDIMNAANILEGDVPAVVAKMIRGCVDVTSASEFLAYCRNSKELRLARKIIVGEPYEMPASRDANIYTISALRALMGQRLSASDTAINLDGELTNICNYGLKLQPELTSLLVTKFLECNRELFLAFLKSHPKIMSKYSESCDFVTELFEGTPKKAEEPEPQIVNPELEMPDTSEDEAQEIDLFSPDGMRVKNVATDAIGDAKTNDDWSLRMF